MPDGIQKSKISAILHIPKDPVYSLKALYSTIRGVLQQYDQTLEVILLDHALNEEVKNEISRMNTEGNKIIYIDEQFSTLGAWLNAARARAEGEYLLYIDNTTAAVNLKNAAATTLLVAADRNSSLGMIYSDYEILEGRKKDEIHLLKVHQGRLRDNQDYGFVHFFSQNALKNIGGFDEALEFNTLYDIRLKLMEQSTLVHLANRYDGSLYQVVAQDKAHNVFDYLLASKESQIEAEDVLTGHLKRIDAYLAPGRYYQQRPAHQDSSDLKASVIIPVNNRPQFISNAIESIFNQTEQKIEIIIVVNGGPDDPTNKVVKDYMVGGTKYDPSKPNVQLISIDINNIGLCLNLGVNLARGKYYVQLDSDDRLKPNAVEKIIELFDSDPKIGIVIGSYEVWELDDKTGDLSRVESIPVVTHDEWTEENGRNNLLRINGAGAPRSIPISLIKEMGYFGINDEPFARNYGEDYEMVLKISEKYRVGRIWDPIYEVVRHKGGTDHSIDIATIQRNDEAKDYMRQQAVYRRKKINEGH